MSTTKTVAERVAEACGWTAVAVREPIEYVPPEYWPIRIDVNWVLPHGVKEWICDFSPEISERHAVLAAEKYGLFRDGRYLIQLFSDWVVYEDTGNFVGEHGSGTFCESICSAILHLESRKPAVG